MVASSICGDEYVREGKRLFMNIQDVALGTSVIFFYSTQSALDEFKGTSLIRLRKWVPRNNRFGCADAKFSLYTEKEPVLWMDIDTVPVQDFRNIAKIFRKSPAAWAALCPESIDSFRSNYYKAQLWSKGVNYYKPNGLNSGVVVFNPIRWRQLNNTAALDDLLHRSGNMYDQDAMNTYFESHRNEVALLHMKYNYRSVSVSGNVVPVIWHFAGTGCAKSHGCLRLVDQ